MPGPKLLRPEGAPPASWPVWLQNLALLSDLLPPAAIVPVPVARTLAEVTKGSGRLFGLIPKKWAAAIKDSPGAVVTEEGLELPVRRYQRPELAGEEAIRGGVFYLAPKGPSSGMAYKGTNVTGHGGSQLIEGRTLVKNPLFIKGGQGGDVGVGTLRELTGRDVDPRFLHRIIGGANAWDWFKHPDDIAEVLHVLGGTPESAPAIAYAGEFASQYRKVLPKDWNPYVRAYDPRSNVVNYATLENAAANQAVKRGYDAVLGVGGGWGRRPAIHEVFDVREARYPGPAGEFWLKQWVQQAPSTSEQAIAEEFLRAFTPVGRRVYTPTPVPSHVTPPKVW